MARIFGKSALVILLLGAALSLPSVGCVKHRSYEATTVSFAVTFTADDGCGADVESACTHSASPIAFTAGVQALRADGTLDTTFNGTVVLSLVPSGLFPKPPDSALLPDGRRAILVSLQDGEAHDVPLTFSRAFGEIVLMVEDYGYDKASSISGAACENLYPAPGCFYYDDDDPGFGTGAAGVSPPVYFENPRIYDVQATDVETVGEQSGYPSPLFGFRTTIDGDSRDDVASLTDCDDGQGGRRELLIVSALTVDGFYVVDACNAAGPAFAGVYMYNFHTPEDLVRGDCLLELTGTVQEFQGFTELKNPFWIVDIDPASPEDPRCLDLLPAPTPLDATMLGDDHVMEGLESGLVTITDATLATEFRPCDINGNGALSGDDEWDCSRDCGDEIECVVLESYQTYFQWTVHKDGREINVKTRGVIEFDPEANLGLQITRITGTLRHLDFGRPAWTIEPRNDADFEL